MATQRGANEVVARGSISEPFCVITIQTVEATSKQKSGRTASLNIYCSQLTVLQW